MSATDFLARRESDLRTWSINFDARISADPAAYGLSAAQAAEYNTLHNAFLAAYTLAAAPGTRTSPIVEAKNAAMRELRQAARRLARIVHAGRVASDAHKSALGLTVRRPGGRQTRIAKPEEAPIVTVEAAAGGKLKVRVRSLEQPTRRGRPAGVMGASIFFFAGEWPPVGLKDWRYAGATTRTTCHVKLPRDVEPGERVWVTACWRNPRAECGPPAWPVCAYRARGGVDLSALRLAA